MTPINVNKNSTLWRLAAVYGPLCPAEDTTNICAFVLACWWGFVGAVGVAAAAGLISAIVGDSLAWVAAMFVTSSWIDPSKLVIAAGAAVAWVAAIVVCGLSWVRWKRYVYAEDHTPSVLVQAYQSFKGKYCVPVKINASE